MGGSASDPSNKPEFACRESSKHSRRNYNREPAANISPYSSVLHTEYPDPTFLVIFFCPSGQMLGSYQINSHLLSSKHNPNHHSAVKVTFEAI
jgi:hypothetical protein